MEATALEIERRLVVADTRVVAIPAVHIRAAATLAGTLLVDTREAGTLAALPVRAPCHDLAIYTTRASIEGCCSADRLQRKLRPLAVKRTGLRRAVAFIAPHGDDVVACL
jgi:hypothetical protein